LHPDWNSESVEFDADISIVVLHNSVEFTRNVEPICLPQPSDDGVAGTGTVVGWGMSGHWETAAQQHDTTPNDLEVPVVNNSHCFLTNDIVYPSSNRTFCAGFVNESKSACSGDSAGGFYLKDSSTKLFNLQGIVSASANDPDLTRNRGCDVNVYSLYTNVAKFIDWIRSEMDKSKEIEWKEVEFECKPLWLWFG
jgi:secreted trypsin-like serine protease